MMPSPAPSPALLAAIVVRTTLVLLVLVVGIRVSGKRRIGELNMYDLVLVLLIANAVQNAMTKSNEHLAVSLVCAGTLLLIGWLFAKMIARWPGLEPRLLGTPTIIVQDGQMVQQHMKHEGVTEEELMTAVRGMGLDDLSNVELAVMELDGFISVVPKSHDEAE
ncbi:MAG TPA: YetF domain-containing protein [Gemmatimonadaceae bacterium]|jgi:uncharacterized membrane protein YcaP (DUF421 family)|nr:YetF domain-containing protein [Gemmatimonadaceae bacterium]